MKYYEKVRSTVEPKELEVLATKVFVAADVQKVSVEIEGETVKEYEYNLTEYDKNEYIEIISKKNKELEEEVTDTEIALCEVYELMS